MSLLIYTDASTSGRRRPPPWFAPAAAIRCQRSARISSPTEPGHCSADIGSGSTSPPDLIVQLEQVLGLVRLQLPLLAAQPTLAFATFIHSPGCLPEPPPLARSSATCGNRPPSCRARRCRPPPRSSARMPCSGGGRSTASCLVSHRAAPRVTQETLPSANGWSLRHFRRNVVRLCRLGHFRQLGERSVA